MNSTRFKLILRKARFAALGLDSWITATFYDSWLKLGAGYRAFSKAMQVFAFTGTKRIALDLVSEGATVGAAGILLLLFLAQPAFDLTDEQSWVKEQDLAVTFLDRTGAEVGRRGIRTDDSVKLDDFPDLMIKALLSTEDRRFYDHFGIDPIGTLRAIVSNSGGGGGGTQGGSTLTQQLAKNLFLSNERTLERKVNEAFLALWLETHLTKNEILKLYLDRAYMGGGNFGAVAAADFYFGKRLQDVNLAEAAMLAGLFKAPTKYSPTVNLPAARSRAVDVLHNMVEAGFVTEGQIQSALRNPATPVERVKPTDTAAEYYLDWAFAEMKKLDAAGKLRSGSRIGSDRVLIVKTALDLRIQKIADQVVETTRRKFGSGYRFDQLGVVIADPDGAVRALVGGTDYGESQFNRATDAMRQPGSSFKPYVYAAALATGKYNPNTAVVDSPVCVGNWCPQNYGRSFSGRQPMWAAVAKSVNSIPVKLSIDIGKLMGISHDWKAAKAGREKIIALAHAMGVTTKLPDTPSLPLGADDMTVMDQASGYAVFANGGRYARGYAALEIRNTAGEIIYKQSDQPAPQVLSSQVVGDMNFMLNKVVEAGTAGRAQLEGRKVAGKTGTTSAYRDAWFVGYTGNLVGAVWIGNDDHGVTAKMTGGTVPAMVWHDIMAPAHSGMPVKPLPGLNDKGRGAVVAQAPSEAGESDANAIVPGKLSRRSFEVISGLNGLFRKLDAPAASEGFVPVTSEPAKAQPIKPEPANRNGPARTGGLPPDPRSTGTVAGAR